MKEVALLGGGRGWQTAYASLGIWQPGKGLLVVQVQGHGDVAFAAPCIKALDATVAVSRPVKIFADFGNARSYDSQFRIKLTSRLAQARSDASSIEVLTQSRLVAMGVAVANLALGGMIKSFVHRGDFSSALDAALKEAGVNNFSSRSLVAA